MRYIILCGGYYGEGLPKQLREIGGEPIIARTIRLLRENGISNIALTSLNPIFDKFCVERIIHENYFGQGGRWLEAFPETKGETVYLFGDVIYSPEAIRQIIETEVDGIGFFASAPPFPKGYTKQWAEPFAFKVVNYFDFNDAVFVTKYLADKGYFKRDPISWELWQVIKGTPLNEIDYTNYCVINDYTCDADNENEFKRLCEVIKPKESNFERKCRVSMAESCFLDQGITQC